MSNDGGEKFITGLIVGTVLGLAIGIFAAPVSGEESRRIVREKVGEFNKNAKEKMDEFGKNARERIDEYGKQIKRGAASSD
jgi:gas vesicle protein